MPMSPRLLRPRAAGGFNPKTIAGLRVWLDAADASSVTLNAGNVSEWRDKSGGGFNLSQGSAALQPSYSVWRNGRNGLGFNAANVISTFSNASLSQTALSVFVAAEQTGADSAQGLLSFPPTGGTGSDWNNANALTMETGTASNLLEYRRGGSALLLSGSGVLPAGVVGWIAEPTQYSAFFNGSLVGSAANGTAGSLTYGMVVGSRYESNTISTGKYFRGNVGEVLVFSRTLTTAERQQVERYLGQKWGISVTPPTASNADAQAWINNVYANGGTVSTATANAVNTFCNDIESAGLRDRFYRLNLFAGTGLSAALVPLFRGPSLGGTQFGNTTDTNNNFVSGDYSESGAAAGLTGNGSTKYLATGLAQTYTGNNSIHQAIGFVPNTAAGYQCFIGARYNLANSVAHEVRGVNANFRVSAFSSGQVTAAYSPSSGRNLFLFNTSNPATAAYDSYSRGAILSTLTMGSGYNAATTGNFMVFAGDTNGTPSAHYSGSADFYSIGARFTSSTQVDDYHAAIAAFRTALSRT